MICQGHEENSWINFLSKEKGNVFVSSKSQTLIKVGSSQVPRPTSFWNLARLDPAVQLVFNETFAFPCTRISSDKEEGNKEGGLKWIVIEVQDQDRVLM